MPDSIALLLSLLSLVVLAAQTFALIDAISRAPQTFEAAGKLSKNIWVGILAVSVLLTLLFGFRLGLFGLASAVATIVYYVDVRPAVRNMGSGGSRWT